MKLPFANSTTGRWCLFALALVGIALLFIPFVGMLPAVVKKVWLFPFFVSTVFAFLGLKISRQWELSPERVTLTLIMLAVVALQVGTVWDGRRQLEALRRKQMAESPLAAGIQQQIAQQAGQDDFEDPSTISWENFLLQKYAAMKLPRHLVTPWWVFEMTSTAILGILTASTLLPSRKSLIRETVAKETMT